MLAAASIVAASVPAHAASSCRTKPIESRFAAATAAFAARPDIAGVSVATAVGDNYRWASSSGMADLEQNVPMTPASKVRIGSISKMLTTAGLVRLAGAKKLDLDAPIQRYVPVVPERDKPITLRLLAGHLAGIRHYVANDRPLGPWGTWDAAYAIEYKSVSDALKIFVDDGLVAEPGERYHYSSYGWTIISAAMEQAAQRPFLDEMDSTLKSLGLRETVPDRAYTIIPDRAASYDGNDDGVLLLAPANNRSFLWAGGGYLSTARDLVHFAVAHQPGPIFSQAQLDEMFTPQRLANGSVSEHGIGWVIGFDDKRRAAAAAEPSPARTQMLELLDALPKTVWHSGGAPGGTSLLVYDPASRVAAAITTNSTHPTDGWYDAFERPLLEAYRDLTQLARRCPAVGKARS
jgi:CubicO group peptidase (beta-lactamase class C family)